MTLAVMQARQQKEEDLGSPQDKVLLSEKQLSATGKDPYLEMNCIHS